MARKRAYRRLLVRVTAVSVALLASGSVAAGSLGSPTERQVVVTVTPVRPYQVGDPIWTSSAPATVIQFATGCQRVPATGYIGSGATGQTTAQYANRWDWSAASSNQSFSWWIKKTDGTTQASGSSSGGGGGRTVAANIYYWRVQNQGGSPQAWNVCYDVI